MYEIWTKQYGVTPAPSPVELERARHAGAKLT